MLSFHRFPLVFVLPLFLRPLQAQSAQYVVRPVPSSAGANVASVLVNNQGDLRRSARV